jgi:LL-diaminopimelate aminotransferase
MRDDKAWLAKMRHLYEERRDVVMKGLSELGIKADPPMATFYVWAEVPEGYSSTSFVAHLLEKAGIVTTPGNGFGDPGEGYFRIALTVSKERLQEAIDRIKKIGF